MCLLWLCEGEARWRLAVGVERTNEEAASIAWPRLLYCIAAFATKHNSMLVFSSFDLYSGHDDVKASASDETRFVHTSSRLQYCNLLY